MHSEILGGSPQVSRGETREHKACGRTTGLVWQNHPAEKEGVFTSSNVVVPTGRLMDA